MTVSLGERPYLLEKRSSLLTPQRIMPKDNAGVLRQCADRRKQTLAHPLIAHQPKARQSVAFRHQSFYSAGMSDDAKSRLEAINQRIVKAAKVADRKPETIQLIAISKTHDAAAIQPLIYAGQRMFGENRVQEAEAKWPALLAETSGIELHLVGQLQSNKAEEAVLLFDAIHSVDRPSLVSAIAKASEKTGRTPACFLQVNIGSEPQKGGCLVSDLPALIAEARAACLNLKGLMAVPPADIEAAPYFALLAKLARDHGLPCLSIGMTNDFETAIMLGATHIRIGSALFGARPTATEVFSHCGRE